ncbi:flagellar hook-associated protein FlgK [Legionella dresdenensis]|uniref:Flagellar hook-associated protein 1 n=1 Tax=Legionella dresdenensis TaxID=450200 RepID=A0ABV8CBR5_9GAMM
MAGILSIASSGLNAFQRALEVTGNNITNVNSSGYSRQSIDFSPRTSQRYAGSFIGSGVLVGAIYRNVDEFANQKVRETTTVKAQYNVFYNQATQVDSLLSQDGTSVAVSLQKFFSSMSQLNESPDSITSRDLLLKQSQLMTEQFKTMQTRLNDYQQNNVNQIGQAVAQVNAITKNIAELNQQITQQRNSPELLDRRDELLRQLSEYTAVTVVDQGDGTVSVGVGSGEVLVSGGRQRDLGVTVNPDGSNSPQIVIKTDSGSIDITSSMKSGMIGGMIDYDKVVLQQAGKVLGQMAAGFALTFNAQHTTGLDMNNQIGKNFFTDYNSASMKLSRSFGALDNIGTGVLSVEISDIGQTQLSDYDITVTDTATNQIRVTRKSDGQVTMMNWADTPPAPPAGRISFDGLTIDVDNIANLADGDKFTVDPFRDAANKLQVKLTDPREIAFASPVRTQADIANKGTGAIALGSIFDTSGVNKEYRIEFISDTQYNLVNVTDSTTTGPMTFTPNADNEVMIPDSATPSYSIVLSGIPKTGDVFTSAYNNGGFGDNRNGLALENLQRSRFFAGGSETVFDRYSNLIGEVGSQTNQAKIRSDAADILNNQAVDYRESKSGVNLDEEAANLLRYQQAYQAAGQLLAVSNQIMQFLYSAMGA